MIEGRKRVTLLALAASSLACALMLPWPRLYRGDGEYVKTGGMYQVRLGTVPLLPGRREFTVRRLGPGWEWILGLRVEAPGRPRSVLFEPGSVVMRAEMIPDVEVAVTVSNERGEVLVSESGPLRGWRWTSNHGSKPGAGHEYQAGPDTFKFRRLGERAEGGWGTRFTPRYSGTYRIRYEVLRGAAVEPGIELWLTLEQYFALP